MFVNVKSELQLCEKRMRQIEIEFNVQVYSAISRCLIYTIYDKKHACGLRWNLMKIALPNFVEIGNT